MSKMMTYGEAIREAMSIRMREDPTVVLFGGSADRHHCFRFRI